MSTVNRPPARTGDLRAAKPLDSVLNRPMSFFWSTQSIFLWAFTSLNASPLEVYILAGQSNMDARAHRRDLPPDLQEPRADILFYYDVTWTALAPGSSSRPSPPDGFGPEISFGRSMADRSVEKRRVGLIKHSKGGTSLAADWQPDTGAQYRLFVAKIKGALASLARDKRTFELRGLVWMQGERDATTAVDAVNYEKNLRSFLSHIRSTLSAPDLPIVIGRIYAPSKPFRTEVRSAQERVSATTSNVVLVDTDDLGLLDVIHFDAPAQIELGRRFAKALLGVTEFKSP